MSENKENTMEQQKSQEENNEQYSVCMEIAGAESIPETNYKAPLVEECE